MKWLLTEVHKRMEENSLMLEDLEKIEKLILDGESTKALKLFNQIAGVQE